MKEAVLDDVVARRFLLGQLPEEEQWQIEELAFTDPDSFTFLQAVETDLMDEFLYGDLSSEEEEQFQKHFLSQPGRRHDLRVARALQKHVTQDETSSQTEVAPPLPEPNGWINWLWPRSTPVRLSLAAIALVLLALLGTWIAVRLRRQQERTPIEAHQQQPLQPATPSASVSPTPAFASASPPTPVIKPPPLQRANSTFSIVLAPGTATRSDGRPGRRFSLLPEHRRVEFKLSLIEKTSYAVFEAELESDGQTIRKWNDLRPQRLQFGRSIVFEAPVELFQAQRSYRIRLSGVSSDGKLEQVNNYDFYIE